MGELLREVIGDAARHGETDAIVETKLLAAGGRPFSVEAQSRKGEHCPLLLRARNG
jgi:hypothetical protein